MTLQRWQVYAVLAIGLFALGLGTGLGLGARHDGKKAQAAQTQADQQEGAALGHAADAQAAHAQGQTQAAAVATADRTVAIARKALAEVQPLPPVPTPADTGDKLVIVKQDALIQAQDQEIASLKLEASIAHAEADQWHKAYDESQRALSLQKIASDARASAEARRGWIHTFEGLAVGVAVGKLAK